MANTLPSPTARLQIKKLGDVPPADASRVRSEVIALAQRIYDEGRAKGRDTLFPVPPQLYDAIANADRKTQFSRVVFDDAGKVIGFTLAYYAGDSATLHLEKIGVDPDYRKRGLMSQMLQESAVRASELGVEAADLLVVKVNSEAIAAYERVGFSNITPEEFRDDPRFNAFHLAVPIPVLLRNTRPQ